MAIADTITSMQNHTSNAYTMIGYGTDLTGINKNLENLYPSIFKAFIESLNNPDTLWGNLPKITGTGTNITLNNTIEAPMKIELSPSELTQDGTPTPSSPQAVHTISGDNTIVVGTGNVLENATWKVGRIESDGSVNTSSSWFYCDYIDISKGNWIFKSTVSASAPKIAIYDSNKNFIRYFDITDNLIIDLSQYNANYLRTSIDDRTSIGQKEVLYDNTDYSIDLSSKNLFKETGSVSNGTYNNGLYISNSLSSYQIMNMNGENITYIANTKYYVSMLLRRASGTGGINAINVGSSTGVVNHFPTISNEFQKYYIEFTPTSDYTSDKISVQVGSASAVFEVKNLMVSTENIDYETYYNYGEYCKIGNYEDRIFKNVSGDNDYSNTREDGAWYIKKNIVKEVLDGTEVGTNYTNGVLYNNNEGTLNYTLNQIVYCNYFSYGGTATNTTGAYNNGNNTISLHATDKHTYYIRDDSLTSLADWKTWLGTNKPELYYVLATPTYTKIEGTLAEQLEAIYKAQSKDGQTNISQVNNDLAFGLSATLIEDLT